MLGIVNLGVNNIRSIYYKLEKSKVEYKIVSSPEDFKGISKIILPGVGNFGKAMNRIDELNIREILVDFATNKKIPFLGICLGMQLMTRGSEEAPGVNGLGIVDADTIKFSFEDNSLKIPHVGWNNIILTHENPIYSNVNLDKSVYFTHSFYVVCDRDEDVASKTNYGIDFCSSIRKYNLFGAQFHPEKSHRNGFQIVENFAVIIF